MSGLTVIGAQAAGLAAALQARRCGSTLPVTVLEKSRHVATGTCGLPLLVENQAQPAGSLALHTREELAARYHLDIRLEHEVTAICPARRILQGRDSGGKTFEVPYQRLVLATGAAFRTPLDVPSSLRGRVFGLRTVEDALRLRQYLQRSSPRRVVVAGGGPLGVEMALVFSRLGLAVELLEKESRLLAGLEPGLSALAGEQLTAAGIEVRTGSMPVGLRAEENALRLRLMNGYEAGADFIFWAAGIEPAAGLAEQPGVQRDRQGYILVDEHMETSVAGIYAAGDCAAVKHRLTGRPQAWGLAPAALHTGRVAGWNAAGYRIESPGLLGGFAVALGEAEAGAVGLSSDSARQAGLPAVVIEMEAERRPAYAGKPDSVKFCGIFNPEDGRLRGCQALGGTGTVALLQLAVPWIAAGWTWRQIMETDLPYHPRLSTPWHPLQQLARLAGKQL